MYTPPIEAPYLTDEERQLAAGFMRWLSRDRKVENEDFFENLANEYLYTRHSEYNGGSDKEKAAREFLPYFAAWVNERIYVTYSDDEHSVVYFTHSDYPSLDKAVEDMLGYYEENPTNEY